MATHSSVLAWRIPGTAEPGGLPSTGSQRVGHDWSDFSRSSSMESRKRYWWTYLQDNRDADVENRLVGTAGEGEGGTNWESSADIFILPPAKQRLVGSCLTTQGAKPSAPDDLEGWGGGSAGRDTQEGGDICIHTHTHTHTHLWLICAVVWQKPTQQCKAIILQLKIIMKRWHWIWNQKTSHSVGVWHFCLPVVW